MPSTKTPPRPSYNNIEWANLVELDLSLFSTSEGKQKLAAQLADAIHHSGFFVVKNFGISEQDIEAQFEICKSVFELPLEEKLSFHDKEKWAKGDIRGYRPIGSKLITRGNFKGNHKDNVRFYNVPKQDGVHDFKHPLPIESKLEEIQSFTQKINAQIVHPLLTLLGLILQLPNPSILTQDHALAQDISNDSLLRYLQYAPLPLADSDANDGIYVAKHVDSGTFACSFRQPVAGLQFLDGDGEWKWVKPMRDGVVVNAADWLGCVTGRWARSGVHRVHAPPIEQIGEDRYAVIYFARPNTDAVAQCVKDSPVLKKLGLKWCEEELDEGMKGTEFTQAWLGRLRREQVRIHG